MQHGQLPTLQRVLSVGVDLVDHHFERITARDEPTLHPVRGKAHVTATQHLGSCHRDGLFARRFHEEAGLALTMGAKHAVFELSRHDHCPQAGTHRLAIKSWVPGVSRTPHDPDETVRHFSQIGLWRIRRRSRQGSAFQETDVTEIRACTWPSGGFGKMEVQWRVQRPAIGHRQFRSSLSVIIIGNGKAVASFPKSIFCWISSTLAWAQTLAFAHGSRSRGHQCWSELDPAPRRFSLLQEGHE